MTARPSGLRFNMSTDPEPTPVHYTLKPKAFERVNREESGAVSSPHDVGPLLKMTAARESGSAKGQIVTPPVKTSFAARTGLLVLGGSGKWRARLAARDRSQNSGVLCSGRLSDGGSYVGHHLGDVGGDG